MLSYLHNIVSFSIELKCILLTIIKWIYFIYWFSNNYDIIKTNSYYAKQLKNKLENLGILGIKLGQYLCTRTDVSTDIIKNELQSFLNNNKIHPIKYTNIILEKAGINNNIILGEIIGSGSLSQVYRCRFSAKPMTKCQLKDHIWQNQELVIKVNHPDLSKLRNEIYAIKSIIKVLSYFTKFKFFINIDWNQFFSMLEKQINLNNERINMEKYYSIYSKKEVFSDITIPQYIMGNEDFIIMTYCNGKTLNTYSRNSMQYKKAHNLLVISTIHTFFLHQIVHGDIHEGNILVQDDGTISIIDFGICIDFIDDEYVGIFAMMIFEKNPTIENMKKAIIALIQPKDIYNNTIDIEKNTTNVYNDYMKIYDNNTNLSINNAFIIVVDIFKKYNILIKNNILYYFINMLLLEGLSPYNDINKLSVALALSYMMKNNFFRDKCNLFLEDFYYNTIQFISPVMIEEHDLKI